MKNIKLTFLFILIVLIQINPLFSQGCSDAGFCTINSLKPDMVQGEKLKNKIKFGASFGKADNSVNAFGSYIEYSRQFNKNIGLSIKLTSLAQSGNDISEFDLSDLFISSNFKTSKNVSLIAGVKIPFNKADKKKDNLYLPMDYQSSLGTYDLILGSGFNFGKLQISAAAQIPLNQNENKFIANNYSAISEIRKFHTTYNFKRSADVLVRITYPVLEKESFTIVASLLPIYHLSNDKYTNETLKEVEIDGSKGLTLNGNVFLNYSVNSQSNIQVSLGFPFKVRDSRPDGLTRSFIANLEYGYSF